MTLFRLVLALLTASLPFAQGVAAPSADGDTPPTLRTFVPAEYPPAAAAARQGAEVLLRLSIDASGAVVDAEVVQGAGPEFDRAAVEAARRFEFTPARLNGEARGVRILYRYAFVPPAPPPATGALSGTIRVEGAAAPLAGVRVRLGADRVAETDASGRFAFSDVNSGDVSVTVEAPGRAPVQFVEAVTAGGAVDVTYELEAPAPEPALGEDTDDFEVIVRAPAIRRQAVVTEVSAETARRLPGTQGDVVKVVDAMPGVGRATTGTGDVIVWGAAADETRVYLDDVPLPRLYHDGGGRSVLGADLVGGVVLVPGGYGAGYGRGLGGLVRVESLDLASTAPRVHASASADVFDVAVGAHGPVLPRLRLGGAARLGHLDRVINAAVPADARGLLPAPRSRDAQLRAQADLGGGARLDIFALHAADDTRRRVQSVDPDRTVDERRDSAFERLGVRLVAPLGDGARLALTGYWGQDESALRNAVGPVETFEAREAALGGARAALSQRPMPGIELEVGLDLELVRSDLERRGAPTQPPREGDPRVFGQPPPVQVSLDRWAVMQVGVAPYATADLTPFGPALHIEPGLRLDPAVRTVSRRDPPLGDTPAIGVNAHDLGIEPRLALRYEASPRWRFIAAGGRYHQPPADRDVSSVFGNPTLGSSRADHALVGARVAPGEALTLEATAFGRWTSDAAVRSGDAVPATARALESSGEARVRGAQLEARLELGKRALGWLAYTLSRSERRGASGGWRLSELDQTHVLTAAASLRPWPTLELGTRLRASTGQPYTAVESAYFDALRDRWEPVFGPLSGARMPAFVQWDLRVSQTLTLPSADEAGQLEVWLEVQNVLNRENIEAWLYDDDYAGRRGLPGLPILPFIGLRWSR